MLELLFAAYFTVCWQPPTENVDGSPVSELTSYSIFWTDTSGVYSSEENIHDIGASTAADQGNCETVNNVTAANYYVVMTVTDAEGDESGMSNEVTIATQTDEPAPPILTQEELVVYTVVKQPNRFVLLPIGTVPPGVSCDMANQVNGHGVVPTESVDWASASSARPVVVVANCAPGG